MKEYVRYIKFWTAIFLLALVVAVVSMLIMDVETGVIMIVVAAIFGVMIIGDFGICFYGMRKSGKDNQAAPLK